MRDDMYITYAFLNSIQMTSLHTICMCVDNVRKLSWIIRYMRSGKDDKQMMCTCVDNMQMIWTMCICADNVQKLSCTS